MLQTLFSFFLVILLSYASVFAVFILIKRFTGWAELERAYADLHTGEKGPKKYFISIKLHHVSYNNSAMFEALSGGLRIRQTFFGLFGTHKPVFIPWTEISCVEKTEHSGIFIPNQYTFRLTRLDKLSLHIPSGVGFWVLEQKNLHISSQG